MKLNFYFKKNADYLSGIYFHFFLFDGTWNFRFLQQSLRNKSLQMNDYKIALLCNAYSTNSECFTLPMGALVETIYGNGIMRIPLPGTSCLASGSITPLPMNLLDSLTVHAKMRYILFICLVLCQEIDISVVKTWFHDYVCIFYGQIYF